MNRQQRFAYNARKRLILKYEIIAGGLIFILLPSLWYYLYGYKGIDWQTNICVACGGLGWLSILLILGWNTFNGIEIRFRKNKSGWFKQRMLRTAIMMTAGILALGYITLLSSLVDKRIDRILNNEASKMTPAYVLEIQIRHSRNNDYRVAIIEYQVNGVGYRREINEEPGEFKTGERLALKYSVDYPEMFKLYHTQGL